MDEQIQLLREMRDLLRVIAEPQLAARDKRLRSALLEVVGESSRRAKAVLLMDGSRSQAELYKQSGMDQSGLSKLVKALRAKELIKGDEKRPELALSVPSNFFDSAGKQDE
jgi:DNA-binding MarR family transcriptional regulator